MTYPTNMRVVSRVPCHSSIVRLSVIQYCREGEFYAIRIQPTLFYPPLFAARLNWICECLLGKVYLFCFPQQCFYIVQQSPIKLKLWAYVRLFFTVCHTSKLYLGAQTKRYIGLVYPSNIYYNISVRLITLLQWN